MSLRQQNQKPKFKIGDTIWADRDGLDIAEIVEIKDEYYWLKSINYWRSLKPGEINECTVRGIDQRYQILTLEDRAELL